MSRYLKNLAPVLAALMLVAGTAWGVQAAGEGESCCCCPECPLGCP